MQVQSQTGRHAPPAFGTPLAHSHAEKGIEAAESGPHGAGRQAGGVPFCVIGFA